MKAAIHNFRGTFNGISFCSHFHCAKNLSVWRDTRNGMAYAVTFVAMFAPDTIQNRRAQREKSTDKKGKAKKKETKRNQMKWKLFHFRRLSISFDPSALIHVRPSTKFDEIHAFIEFLMIYISVSEKFKFGNFFARRDGFAFIRIDDTFFAPEEPKRHRHVQMRRHFLAFETQFVD